MFRKGRPLEPWLHFGLPFGVILGAKFATILLLGRPGVQIGRKKRSQKKDRKKVERVISSNPGEGPLNQSNPEDPQTQHGPSNTPLRALGARWRITQES